MPGWSAGKRVFLSAVLLVLAPACAYHGSSHTFQPERLAKEEGWLVVPDVPVVMQTTATDCGAASMSMILGYWGSPMTVGQITNALPATLTDGEFRAGDLRDFAREHGLHAFVVAAGIPDLQDELSKKRPVIVGLVKRYSRNRGLSHYEVVVGYDAAKQRILTLDPAYGWREDSVAGFMKEWESSGRLALVAFP